MTMESDMGMNSRISKIRIPENAKKIIGLLEEAGYEAFVVGGCVRDAVFGRTPSDWDITTQALPEEMLTVFRDLHVVPTGLKHGTVTVVMDGENYEVTTYRVDGEYKDSRHPESVEFVRDITEDLSRRDFTINAMAYSDERGFVDHFGGMEDLERGVIRCVGDPEKRFSEDALRILRCVRFASQLGFSIEEETARAIYDTLPLLGNIAAERIRVEFEKLLCGARAGKVLEEHREVIASFIPEIRPMFDLDQENPFHLYDVWMHTVHAVSAAEAPGVDERLLKLAAFFHDIGKPPCKVVDRGWGHFYHHEHVGADMTDEIMRRLRFDNETRKTVVMLIKKHGTVFNPNGKQARRLMAKMGEDDLALLIALEKADVSAQHPDYVEERLENIGVFEEKVRELAEGEQCFRMGDMKVDGRDIMALGVEQGREIGRIKNELFERVVEGLLENDREVLLAEAKTLVSEMVKEC